MCKVSMIIFAMLVSLTVQIIQTNDQPVSISSLVGKSLVIPCQRVRPDDVKDIKLQWSKDMFGLESSTLAEVYKNRIFVPEQTSTGIFDLHFKRTEVDDQGLYGCHVDITYNNGTMANIVDKFFLKIIVPPSNLQIQPKTINSKPPSTLWLVNVKTIWGIEGRNLILMCIVKNGQPIAQILWKIKTKFGDYDLSNSLSDQSAVIKLFPKHHDSIVSCNIRNKEDYLGVNLPGTNYTLRVLYISKTEIINENYQNNGDIRENEMVNYICKATTPEETNIRYSWYIQYSIFNIVDHYLVNDSTSNSFSIKLTQKHHNGRLHCLLKVSVHQSDCDRPTNNACELKLVKDVQAIHSFNVLYPPKIVDPFESLTVINFGEWVTLTCKVDSNPVPAIKWYKSYTGTTKSSRSVNWYHQTKISSLVESLRFENMVISGSYHKFQILTDNDLDIYICEAKSAIFASAYKYVVVAKEEEISITVDRQQIKVQEGGSASLMCIIEGWPRPMLRNIKWHHSDSRVPLIFNDRIYVVNKNRLMAVESKLYIKNVLTSDYGSYNCSITHDLKFISRKIDLKPIGDPGFIFTIIGIIGIIFVASTIIIIIYISRKLYNQKKKEKCQLVDNIGYSSPNETSLIPSPTIESSIENEMMFNRFNSLQYFRKGDYYIESLNANSHRNFIANNNNSQMPSLFNGDACGAAYEGPHSKRNNSCRSWDSGVCPDDALFRNNHVIYNPIACRGMSPFSVLADSSHSIGPSQYNPPINTRYWQPITATEQLITAHHHETNSNGFNNTDQGSNFNGSIHSSFIPSSIAGSRTMIASSGNQSFVCIPIEEYQQHMRLLQESRGDPSVISYSSTSFSNNIEASAFSSDLKKLTTNMETSDDKGINVSKV